MIPTRPRLLLEACLGVPGLRSEAWNRWVALTRFEDIDLASYALLPSVGYFNRDERLAESSRLRGVFRHNWAVNQERFRLVLVAVNALQREGLEPVLIKGAALAEPVYGSLGARRMADIDVLVAGKHFARAADILAQCGFSPGSGFVWPQASVKSCAFTGQGDAQVDLHSRPLQAPWDEATESLMRAGSGRVTFCGHTVPTLSASANLVVAVVHGMQFDRRGSYQWILDAVLLIRSGGIDWTQVCGIGRMLNLDFAVSRGLHVVLPWVPPGSVPASALKEGLRLRQRIEQSFRTREPGGVLGALPNLYLLFLRERERGLWSGSLGDYLRDAWQVPANTGLGAVLVRKLLRRAGSVLSASHRPAP